MPAHQPFRDLGSEALPPAGALDQVGEHPAIAASAEARSTYKLIVVIAHSPLRPTENFLLSHVLMNQLGDFCPGLWAPVADKRHRLRIGVQLMQRIDVAR